MKQNESLTKKNQTPEQADNKMKLKFTLILFIVLLSACSKSTALKPFKTDGCSLFTDGDLTDRNRWCDCCVRHDIAYWQGGTEQQRLAADKALKACVLKKTGNETFAEMMYKGVRAGGSSVFPNWYRWGYGWDYGEGDKALTQEQQQQVSEALKAIKSKTLTCPG